MPSRFHYHLGLYLPQSRSENLQQILAEVAQPQQKASATSFGAPLFLSLVVIAEAALQHPFLRQRCAAAFDRPLPPAVDFHFRAIGFDKEFARLPASRKTADAAQLIAQLAELLAAQGVFLPPQSAVTRPYIKIGAAPQPQPDVPLDYRWQWTPTELALIEVDAHNGQQRSLHRWSLSNPIQPSFAFDEWEDAA